MATESAQGDDTSQLLRQSLTDMQTQEVPQTPSTEDGATSNIGALPAFLM